MNTVRHAFAQQGGSIAITLTTHEDQVQCRVSDDGRGSCGPKPGRGSQIIEAIAAELGGRVTRENGACGTTVLLTIPRQAGNQKINAAGLASRTVELAG